MKKEPKANRFTLGEKVKVKYIPFGEEKEREFVGTIVGAIPTEGFMVKIPTIGERGIRIEKISKLSKGRENKLSNPNMEEKKYYDYFIENVQKTLGLDEEQVEKLKSVAVQYGVDWKLDPEPEENFSNPSNPKKHLTALQIIIISLRGEIITRRGVYGKYSDEYYEWKRRTEKAIEKELRDKNDEIEYMTVKEVGSNPIRELSSPNPITEEEVTEVKEWLDKIRKKRKIKGAISDKIVLEELKEEAKGKGGKS